MIDYGFIKLPVYRTNTAPYAIPFFNKIDGVEYKLDLTASFSDVIMEVRAADNDDSKLIKRLSLLHGSITVSDTNVLNFNLQLTASGGTYYADVMFRKVGESDYQTYLKGIIPVENNISRT